MNFPFLDLPKRHRFAAQFSRRRGCGAIPRCAARLKIASGSLLGETPLHLAGDEERMR